MPLFGKLKKLLGGASEESKETAPDEESTVSDEPDEEEQDDSHEEELLNRLTGYKIVQSEVMSRSVLQMHIYRFEKPFDGVDMRTLVEGMRWLGFRLYTFSVRVEGRENECESWVQFSRMLVESEAEGCSFMSSFCGVRVHCSMDADGVIHLGHDSSRGVDFAPFEELFSPEEVEED